VKRVVNDDGGSATPGDFTLAVTGAGADPASFKGDDNGVAVSLRRGPYTVSESDGPAGYAASMSDACAGTIALGETKTCTVTNNDRPARLIVVKKVVNDDGGSANPDDFTLAVTGTGADPASFKGDPDGVAVSLRPGRYELTESGGPAGYAASMSEGCAGTIALGETETCTVTNDDRPARLIVIERVVNDDGGSAQPDDFTLAVSGTAAAPTSFKGDADGVAVRLHPRDYDVREAGGPTGYAVSISDACTGEIALGETKTCVVTNDDRPTRLIVVKKVVNDDGGTAQPGDFTLTVTGSTPRPASFHGDPTGVSVTLLPGPYSVAETAGPAGYAAAMSEGCAGSIALGETKTCAVTNDDVAQPKPPPGPPAPPTRR
jgi:uncharacterized surface anchored protein